MNYINFLHYSFVYFFIVWNRFLRDTLSWKIPYNLTIFRVIITIFTSILLLMGILSLLGVIKYNNIRTEISHYIYDAMAEVDQTIKYIIGQWKFLIDFIFGFIKI